MAQVARQAQQQAAGVAGQQMAGVEFGAWTGHALQQFTAVSRVKAASAAGVEQVIGAGHAQQQVPGKIHRLQRNLQLSGQLQGDQCQRQRLSTAALQHPVQQGGLGAGGQVIVFVEIQLVEAAQQRLGQLACGQVGQPGLHLLAQVGEVTQDRGRLQLCIVLGGDAQGGFE